MPPKVSRANSRNKRKDLAKSIAREQIERYLNMAQEVFLENKSLANRYVTLARNTAMKYQVRIPSQLKRCYCRHCYKFIRPGVNASVRTSRGKGGHVVYYCKECGKYTRFPYARDKKSAGRGTVDRKVNKHISF